MRKFPDLYKLKPHLVKENLYYTKGPNSSFGYVIMISTDMKMSRTVHSSEVLNAFDKVEPSKLLKILLQLPE